MIAEKRKLFFSFSFIACQQRLHIPELASLHLLLIQVPVPGPCAAAGQPWGKASRSASRSPMSAPSRERRRIMGRDRRILVIIAEPQNVRKIGRPSSFLLVHSSMYSCS